jgi:hypothetical protein
MKTPKNKIPFIFDFLYELTIFNNRAILVNYPDSNRSSLDILMIGSGSLPRKKKKHLRKLILNERAKKGNEHLA